MTVRFAKVKAGHDKDHVYLVIGEDENKVFLVNGTTKKMQNPKKVQTTYSDYQKSTEEYNRAFSG